jgi:hypothetical protein
VTSNNVARCIYYPHFCFSCNDHVVLDKMHTDNFLTIHVEIKQLLLVLNAKAKYVSLDVAECNDVLIPVYSN